MERDFTTETYNDFCILVNKVKDDHWLDIRDWFGDRFWDIKHLLQEWGILHRTREMETYYKELLDRKDSSKAKITQIFRAISCLDSSSVCDNPGQFAFCKNQLAAFRQALTVLTNIMVCGQREAETGYYWDFASWAIPATFDASLRQLQYYSLTDYQFTASSFKKLSEEAKEVYVKNYELLHPDLGGKMRKVLSDSDWTDQEKLDIRFLAYCAPEPYRSIYFEHVSCYKVNVFQKDSLIAQINDNSRYNHSLNIIFLKDDDATLLHDPRGPYNTFFHESGHAIDDYEHTTDWHLSPSFKFDGKNLEECIIEDTRNYISSFIDKECKEIPEDSKNQLLLHMNLSGDSSFSYGGSLNELNGQAVCYRQSLLDSISEDLTGEANEAASDVYGGVTNNAIMGGYGHYKKQNEAPESFNYWYKGKTSTKNQVLELWAEFFAAQMTHDEKALASIEAHFPTAYPMLEKMACQMAAK